MITAVDLIAWLRWADDGANEAERGRRLARVEKFVFPDGLDEAELASRRETADFVKRMGRPPSWLGFSDPREPPDGRGEKEPALASPLPSTPSAQPPPPPPAPPPLEWDGLISPKSAAYRRGMIHDGTLARGESLRRASRGSPFDAVRDFDEEERQERQKIAAERRRRGR